MSKTSKEKLSKHMAEIGRKGGLATAKKKGKKYMAALGKKGYEALAKKRTT